MGASCAHYTLKLRTLLEERLTDIKRAALELQSYLIEMDQFDFDVELSNVPLKGEEVASMRLDYVGPNELVRDSITLSVSQHKKTGNTIYKAETPYDGIIYAQSTGWDAAFILFRAFQKRGHFKAFEQSLQSAFLTTNVTHLDPQRLVHDDLYGAEINAPFSVGEKYEKVRVDSRAVFKTCDVYITAKNTVRIDLEDSQHDLHKFEGDTLYKAIEQARPFVKQAIDTYKATKKAGHV